MRIQPKRLTAAVHRLSDWASSVQTQASQHIWPLLALLESNISTTDFEEFKEDREFEFWDKYFRLPGDTRDRQLTDGSFVQGLYAEPLTRRWRAADHPHRGPFTIRQRTFKASWGAVKLSDDLAYHWRLSPDYPEIVLSRMLTKGGQVRRIPAIDLAIWLFRSEEFDPDSGSEALTDRLRDRFHISQSVFRKLFEVNPEPSDHIFGVSEPTDAELAEAIRAAMLAPEQNRIPAVRNPGAIDLGDDDPHLLRVQELIDLNTSGVILRGCPGTGKTWKAREIAKRLVADPVADIFHVQFHPSYGYEDFVEGYKPDPQNAAGFDIVDRVLLLAAKRADGDPESRVILIVDEINRGDPSRVFGELLTFIEIDYRGKAFTLPFSGRQFNVPPNLLLIGTMNPYDKSISMLDEAFLRRFDFIDIEPSSSVLGEMLAASSSLDPEQSMLVIQWFDGLQQIMPHGLGHSAFRHVRDLRTLEVVWRHRVLPYCDSALEFDARSRQIIRERFDALIRSCEAKDNDG